jgi:hypothetical protein
MKTNILTLKLAEPEAPFQFYVFAHTDCDETLTELFVNDENRYDKVLACDASPYSEEFADIIQQVENGDYYNEYLTVLR